MKKSPLHAAMDVREELIPVTPELRRLALKMGAPFGLDIYGVDVVETPQGWVGVDINDFPSFGGVPGAVVLIAKFILHVARRAEMQRAVHATGKQRRHDPTGDGRSWHTRRAHADRGAAWPPHMVLTRRRHP
jgi:hypothetical protein